MVPSQEAHKLVLSFADDELCIGQNHSWWIAIGPFLEEDLAFTSIAQDELGHARALYSLLSDDIDQLAYGRDHSEYRSAHITEFLCHDWSSALVRHVLHDMAEQDRWSALTNSSWTELGNTAQRALAEENFHLQHGLSLLRRLLSSDEGRKRLEPVVLELAPYGREYFADSDQELMDNGLLTVSMADQERIWVDQVLEVFDEFNITVDMSEETQGSGRSGIRSNDFATLHDEMTAVIQIDPHAQW
ncbi:MAG TPA: phenylacetate-CoA oxygenase subunit PaaI [Acidimicrobiaceae bacterium]|nr:phenylacetate-CoA oxygenase subunit PaaI [Acidimicrobiaceae bacterium]